MLYRYLQIFNQIDLKKNFYYCTSYDLSNTLQDNLSQQTTKPRDIFIWNNYLTSMLSEEVKQVWTSRLVHGYFDAKQLVIFGRTYNLILIARRSTEFAGTRYLKRGISRTVRYLYFGE